MPRSDSVEPVPVAPEPIEILVCTTCRGTSSLDGAGPSLARDTADGAVPAPRAGAVLLERLRSSRLPDGVRVSAVECLSNCSRGCTVALRGGARRWTYVYGDLGDDVPIDTLLDGARRYRDAPRGLVPWRERPVHFRKHCIARVPPTATEPE